ncbi:MAG: hypothetical protein HY080_07290 [Gammaproteobacteria bacterium]|nr:hypothetical protein [Gammaproteobacteria bacterium]
MRTPNHALKNLAIWRGLPQAAARDNGPEFLAPVFVVRCHKLAIEIRYIYIFGDLDEIHDVTHRFAIDYNE